MTLRGKAHAQLGVPTGAADRARDGQSQSESSRHTGLQSGGRNQPVIMLPSGPRGKPASEACWSSLCSNPFKAVESQHSSTVNIITVVIVTTLHRPHKQMQLLQAISLQTVHIFLWNSLEMFDNRIISTLFCQCYVIFLLC